MGSPTWLRAAELDAASSEGELRHAVTLAEELRIEHGKPIELRAALRFLPLIARDSLPRYSSRPTALSASTGSLNQRNRTARRSRTVHT